MVQLLTAVGAVQIPASVVAADMFLQSVVGSALSVVVSRLVTQHQQMKVDSQVADS